MSASKSSLIIILGALTAFGPMSIDMYLPSLPALQQALATDAGSVQFTLASFFIGLTVGQVIYGPVSDRFGRKPPLYAGLLLYVLASIGCAFAPSIQSLIGLRFVQALGACAGMVIARAMVRDLFDAQTSARVFSLLVLVMGVAPILAPLAGGYLLTALGWQAIFGALALFGLACLLAVAWGLPETRSSAQATEPLRLGTALRGYAFLLKDRLFVGYALAGGVVFGGMFAYISGSPFVFIELHGVSPDSYGWLFGINAFGLILASQVNRRLLSIWSADAILSAALTVAAVFGLLVFAVGATGFGGLTGLLLSLFCFIASLGFTQANSMAGAMAHHGPRAGSASALLGTLQFAVATLAGISVGALDDGTARPMTLVIAVCAVVALLIYRGLVRGRAVEA